jgi:hypothetical protein
VLLSGVGRVGQEHGLQDLGSQMTTTMTTTTLMIVLIFESIGT